MKKTTRHHYFLVAFGVVLFALLMNLKAFGGALQYIGSMILPVMLGFVLAFIINVPMRGFEKLFEKLTFRMLLIVRTCISTHNKNEQKNFS